MEDEKDVPDIDNVHGPTWGDQCGLFLMVIHAAMVTGTCVVALEESTSDKTSSVVWKLSWDGRAVGDVSEVGVVNRLRTHDSQTWKKSYTSSDCPFGSPIVDWTGLS